MRIFRLGKVFSILLGILTISVYAYGSFEFLQNRVNVLSMMIGLASLFFLICAGYLMNDYCDLAYDLINRPQTVLITKVIIKKKAKQISFIFFGIGILLALLVNAWFFLLIILDAIIMVLYNLYSKRLFYIKNVIISLLVVSIYPLSVALASGGNPSLRRDSLFIFPVWLFLIVISYEFSQDILDVVGDSVEGGNTLPVMIGVKKTRTIATVLAVFSIPIVFVPFYYGMCGKAYIIGVLMTLPVFVVSIFSKEVRFSKGSLFFIRAVTISSLIDIIIAKG